MITSLYIAIAGYVLLAFVAILDKFILSKSIRHPAVYTFYSTIFFIALVPFLFFLKTPLILDVFWSLFSGIIFGLALWTFFIALKRGETSHVVPFVGAITAVATYILSSTFLKEEMSTTQMLGLGFLVVASILFSYERSLKQKGFHVGFPWATLSGVFFAISAVSAKYIYTFYPFVTGLLWTKVGVGLVGIIIYIFYKKYFHNGSVEKRKNTGILIFTDKILGVLAVILIQYAISIGSVTIVNAMVGVEYALTFIFIYIMTRIAPKIFSEYFTRDEVALEIIAIILAITGIILLK